ncbi:MAG TPA: alpha/beta hydrolase [Steroidobacteraceae bacterium]|jgi:pimeloyl-ACP methyl ester carboxylesterase|nr:alpha/beta hydrolase [Steroidobacteraceae bacterium]
MSTRIEIMAFFHDDELTIHYLERGRGEPLLLIHGLGCSGADWAFQVAALEHRFRIIVPDLPGSGHSLPPRNEYTIAGFAAALWKLMDHLQIVRPNIVGFSLGGAVALEMATLRPACVPRLGLINSLATYLPRDLRKWLETYVAATLVRLLGMPRAACLMAARLFPEPWQRAMREHAARALGSVPANSYLGTGFALARWAILDRLDRLKSRVLLIAAENDFTPLAEKRELARRLRAELVVVRGSRHGTPFDSVEVTNASLLALLTDQPLPPATRWVRDTPTRAQALSLTGSIAEEHAVSPLLLD